MRQIRSIISFTIKESFRNKLIGGVAFFGLILIALSNLISKLSVQEQLKFIKDLGMSGIAFFGQLMAIIIGSSLIADEYERKTISQILTNPVKPSQYILGRFFGIAIILFLNIVFFTLVFYGSLIFSYVTNAYREMPPDVYVSFFTVLGTQIGLVFSQNIHLLAGIWMIFIQMMIIASIAMLLSFFLSKIINFVVCLVIFVVGHLTIYINYYSSNLSLLLKIFVKTLLVIIPSYEYFNISDYLVLNRIVSLNYQFWVFLYGIIYVVPVLLLCILVFDMKETK